MFSIYRCLLQTSEWRYIYKMKYVNMYKKIKNIYKHQIHSYAWNAAQVYVLISRGTEFHGGGSEPLMVDRMDAQDNRRDQEDV